MSCLAAVPKVKKGALPASAVSRAQEVVKELTSHDRAGPSKELLRWTAGQQTTGYAITAKPSANLYILLQVAYSCCDASCAMVTVMSQISVDLILLHACQRAGLYHSRACFRMAMPCHGHKGSDLEIGGWLALGSFHDEHRRSSLIAGIRHFCVSLAGSLGEADAF